MNYPSTRMTNYLNSESFRIFAASKLPHGSSSRFLSWISEKCILKSHKKRSQKRTMAFYSLHKVTMWKRTLLGVPGAKKRVLSPALSLQLIHIRFVENFYCHHYGKCPTKLTGMHSHPEKMSVLYHQSYTTCQGLNTLSKAFQRLPRPGYRTCNPQMWVQALWTLSQSDLLIHTYYTHR